jgi:hypothetical protein
LQHYKSQDSSKLGIALQLNKSKNQNIFQLSKFLIEMIFISEIPSSSSIPEEEKEEEREPEPEVVKSKNR